MGVNCDSGGGSHDAGCGPVTGMRDSAGGMELFNPPVLLSNWGRCPDRSGSFASIETPSRRSCMDLSKINSMTAARCEFSPDEELRMILESKAPSTDGFSSDWKSSCSISLICLWLHVSYISKISRRLSGNTLPRNTGG